MRFSYKIKSLEREAVFRDPSERRLFWQSSVENLRHLAVCLQMFGIASWVLSRIFAHQGTTFDKTYAIIGLVGMLIGVATTCLARSVIANSFGSFICAASIALCFHSNAGGTLNPEFWVIPMAVVITVGMAPVFVDYYSYLASTVAVWAIISHGEIDVLLKSRDSTWIVLTVISGISLGLMLNYLFVQERKKVFLVQRELVQLAFKDALTGLDNRRSLMESMQDCHARAAASSFYLLLIDVDDFKRINDTSGHDVGDRALVAVAAVIDQHAQTYPHGRLGGEEFGVVFAGEERDACAFAKALCEGVATLRVATHAVTISIGISKFNKALSVADIFRMADQGLYEAKRKGKNNFVLVS